MVSSTLLALGLPDQLAECRQKPLPENFTWVSPDPGKIDVSLPGAAGIFIFAEALAATFPYALVPRQVPVFVNHVLGTLADFPSGAAVVRMNAWPGFFGSGLLELSASAETRVLAERLLDVLGWSREWIPDVHGLVRPRVISMIINEACFARGEQVSSVADIDTAMKLGTNYPRGPFAWASLIGPERVYRLLAHLSSIDPRYTPAPGMLDILHRKV
jgi:3-hydroxybutyryl-CoA dehydrogenase